MLNLVKGGWKVDNISRHGKSIKLLGSKPAFQGDRVAGWQEREVVSTSDQVTR